MPRFPAVMPRSGRGYRGINPLPRLFGMSPHFWLHPFETTTGPNPGRSRIDLDPTPPLAPPEPGRDGLRRRSPDETELVPPKRSGAKARGRPSIDVQGGGASSSLPVVARLSWSEHVEGSRATKIRPERFAADRTYPRRRGPRGSPDHRSRPPMGLPRGLEGRRESSAPPVFAMADRRGKCGLPGRALVLKRRAARIRPPPVQGPRFDS